MTIILISNEPWGDIWYSKQHYANELSKLGNDVYFINAPKSWSFTDLFSWRVYQTKIKENLSVIDYHNPFPLRFFPSFMLRLNDAINRRKLKRALSNEKKTIIWQFDHNRFVNTLGLSKKERRVYHIADPYMNAVNNKKISALADLLVCTSTKYLPFYQNGKKEPLYIPHAISEEEFHISPQKVKALEKHFGGYVLMVGGLNHDVDFDLLEQISNQFSLVILGKLQTKESEDWEKWGLLKEKDNVHALGVVHAKELKNYIAASKVCITAYQFDLQEKGGNRSPLKILNYIAQKKPVVTSIDSEVNELDGELIFCEKDKKSYLDRIAQLMQTEKFDMNEELIIQFLGERTYPKMIEKIFEKLNED